MAKQALWVMLKAKPGKEAEVEAFLAQGASLANNEPKTVTWYGVKMAPGMYGVFDTFNDEEGRDAHLNGQIAKALMAKAPELFANEHPHRTHGNSRLEVTTPRRSRQPPSPAADSPRGSSASARLNIRAQSATHKSSADPPRSPSPPAGCQNPSKSVPIPT